MYYVLALAAFLVHALLYIRRNHSYIFKDRDRVYLFIFFALAALVMGLRGLSVGVDTQNYSMHFYRIVEAEWNDIFKNLNGIKFNGIEIGYVFLMKLSSLFSDSYFFFQFFVAWIFCFSIMTFYKDDIQSKIILTTVFLGSGLYLLAFNINRQMLAVAFTVLSWKSLRKKKNTKAMIQLLIAVSFHTSAVIFAAAFLLYLIRRSKYLLYTVLAVGIVAAINYQSTISFVSQWITGYERYLPNVREMQTIGLSGVRFGILLFLSSYVLLTKGTTNIERIYAIFSIGYVVCNLIGLRFNYFERVGIYFLPFTIFLLDICARKIRKKSSGLALIYKSGVTVSYTLFFLLSTTTAQYAYRFY